MGVSPAPVTRWEAALVVGALVLVPLFIYFLAPPIDFRLNRVWRTEWNLRLNPQGLRMQRPGAKKYFDMAWSDVSKLEENERVYLLYYGDSGRYVLIPKHVFEKPQQLAFFRRQVARVVEGKAKAPGTTKAA
jgi:hypothetical protein